MTGRPFFLSHFLQTHKLDPSNHYLRLKVWNDGQVLFYVPKHEEDISDVVRKHTLTNKSLRSLNSTTAFWWQPDCSAQSFNFFFHITLLYEQHRKSQKMTLAPHYSATVKPVMSSLCDGALLAIRWTLSEQSHCRTVFFLERPLISSSFSPPFILGLR